MWGQERSSTLGWRRDGDSTDERTCTLVGNVVDEVEGIGTFAPSFPPSPQKNTGDLGKIKQRRQRENIDNFSREDERQVVIVKTAT